LRRRACTRGKLLDFSTKPTVDHGTATEPVTRRYCCCVSRQYTCVEIAGGELVATDRTRSPSGIRGDPDSALGGARASRNARQNRRSDLDARMARPLPFTLT